MKNLKTENRPIEIPNQEKTNINNNIISVGNKPNCLEMSNLRRFIDLENKVENNVTIKESNKHIEGSIIHDNSYNINASNLQAINSITIKNKNNSKIPEESAETKPLFYVELKDYFFTKLFKKKSRQLRKFEQFKSVIKDILSIEFLLEAINDISELKNKLQAK